MENQQPTTRSRSRAAMESKQRNTDPKRKSAERDERDPKRAKKPGAVEANSPSTEPKKMPTTAFQKTGAVLPSNSGHRQRTSTEGNDGTRYEVNRPAHGSLASFDITPLATVLKFRRIFSKASIPSPLWPRALEWRPTGENPLFNNARSLYREIYNQRRTLQEEVRTQADFYNPVRASRGLLCWWEYLKPRPNQNRDDSNNESAVESVDSVSGDLNYAWVGETIDFNT